MKVKLSSGDLPLAALVKVLSLNVLLLEESITASPLQDKVAHICYLPLHMIPLCVCRTV